MAAIAEKSLKETTYHLRWSSEWVIRLGDGTEESHQRINNALSELWMFTGEMFIPSDFESAAYAPNLSTIKEAWYKKVEQIFTEATLQYQNRNGRKMVANKENIQNTWAICLQKCNTCKGLIQTQHGNRTEIWQLLEEVKDPEVPVLSYLI